MGQTEKMTVRKAAVKYNICVYGCHKKISLYNQKKNKSFARVG